MNRLRHWLTDRFGYATGHIECAAHDAAHCAECSLYDYDVRFICDGCGRVLSLDPVPNYVLTDIEPKGETRP